MQATLLQAAIGDLEHFYISSLLIIWLLLAIFMEYFFINRIFVLGYFNKPENSRSLVELKWQVVQRSKSHVTLPEEKIVVVLWVCIFLFFCWEPREFYFSYHK